MSRIYNELTAVTVTAEPLDSDGAAFTPTTARYRLDDCRSKKSLIGWTSLTPSTAMTIAIPGSVNAIVDNMLNKPEVKTLTVSTDIGLTTQQYSEYTYRIQNLGFAQAS